MEAKIMIEKMSETDLGEVLSLALKTPELWDSEEPGYFSKNDLSELLKSPDDVCLKATVDGKFAGYILVTYHKYLRGAYLMDISIKPEYRKLGVANKFFTETEKLLREKGCRWAWGLVHEKNERMQGIMEKKGFFRGRKWVTYYKEF